VSLEADERQEFGHAMRKSAEMAALMYGALTDVGLPDTTVEALLVEWWREINRTPLQMPDFGELFKGDEA